MQDACTTPEMHAAGYVKIAPSSSTSKKAGPALRVSSRTLKFWQRPLSLSRSGSAAICFDLEIRRQFDPLRSGYAAGCEAGLSPAASYLMKRVGLCPFVRALPLTPGAIDA